MVKTPFPKLSAPTQRALAAAGISCVEDLAKHSEKEVKDLHGMGPNALGKLKAAMENAGVQFKT